MKEVNYELIKFYLENEKKWDAFEYLTKEVEKFPEDIGNIINSEEAVSKLLTEINSNRDNLMTNLQERLKKEFSKLKIQRGKKGKKYFYIKLTREYYNDKINFDIFLFGNTFDAVKAEQTTCWVQLYVYVNSKNSLNKYSKKLRYSPTRYIYNYMQYKEYEENLSNKAILVKLFPLTEIDDKMFDNCIKSIQSYLKKLTGRS